MLSNDWYLKRYFDTFKEYLVFKNFLLLTPALYGSVCLFDSSKYSLQQC